MWPPRAWNKACLDLDQVELHRRDVAPLLTEGNAPVLDQLPEFVLDHAPVATLGRLHDSPGGSLDAIHKPFVTLLGCENRSKPPRPARVIVRIFVFRCALLVSWQQTSNVFPIQTKRRVHDQVVVTGG